MSPNPIDFETGDNCIYLSDATGYDTWHMFSKNISKDGYGWAHWITLF